MFKKLLSFVGLERKHNISEPWLVFSGLMEARKGEEFEETDRFELLVNLRNSVSALENIVYGDHDVFQEGFVTEAAACVANAAMAIACELGDVLELCD